MTDVFSKMTVQTEHYGPVQVWMEARVQSPHSVRTTEIWAAAGADVYGSGHRGYGETAAEAVVDVLMCMETGRRDRLEVTPEFPGSTFAVPFNPMDVEPVVVYQGLPDEFWEAIRADRKIIAIKELRAATNLTLVAAKSLVDYIIPAGKSNFTAARAPAGTIIRIQGTLGHLAYWGWVFEKTPADNWLTTGDECPWNSVTVQAAMDDDGFDILYTPKEN